jgi:S-formylglutathione hydrolase
VSAGSSLRSEHASFGGTQGFYEHVSERRLRGAHALLGVPAAAGARGRAVPALYYLAGLTCSEEHLADQGAARRGSRRSSASRSSRATRARARRRYPGDDASWDFGVGAGFYLDATEAPWSASYRMETHVTRELVAWVEDAFPIARDRRGIFGHSMGGHGALTLALRHPDLYTSVSALAPIVAPSEVPWGQKAFAGYLGEDRARWAEHDTCALVRSRPRKDLELFVDQGTSDKFLERELQPERLEAACAASGQPLRLRRHEGYDHSYYFIATVMDEHLRHHANALGG